jgi:hypothetical protein
VTIGSLLHWLNESGLSLYLRQSDLAFPLTEAIHLIGLGFSVGIVLWIDLRLTGLALRREPLSSVVAKLEPWAIRGFAIMIVSGVFLFLSKPETYAAVTAFRIKLVLLVFAGLNVLFFHRVVLPNVAKWEESHSIPWQARFVGMASILLWIMIAILGRWTAYFADPLYTLGR